MANREGAERNPTPRPVSGIIGVTTGNGPLLDKQPIWTSLSSNLNFDPAPQQPAHRQFGNAVPLGLCATGMTTLVLSLINLNIRGVTLPTIVVGMAYSYGGIIQLLAGMWEMASGNTFAATVLASYGGFWISWALIETQPMGILADYHSKADLNHTVSLYLGSWTIFTFMCMLGTLKTTLAFTSLFFFLKMTLFLLTMAYFWSSPDGVVEPVFLKVGGFAGVITSFLCLYNALAGMLDKSNSFFVVPLGHLPWSEHARRVKREAAAAQRID